MQAVHAKEVLAIYQHGMDTGNATFNAVLPSWSQWDENHLDFARWVAVHDDQQSVLGWSALSPASARLHYQGVAEVSVYIHPEHLAKGYGKALLAALIADSEDHGMWTLTASIFPENAASVALHQCHGFVILGRRKSIAQLNGVWRDTVLMERRSTSVGID